jgi:predicted transcriptional regulator
MRTTVDLPPALHRRALELAKQQGRSLSAVVAELTLRGLAQLETPVALSTDNRSGLPVLSLGRTVSADDVVAALDDE